MERAKAVATLLDFDKIMCLSEVLAISLFCIAYLLHAN